MSENRPSCTLALAGSEWQIGGVAGSETGRLREAVVNPGGLPGGTVDWCWQTEPEGWQPMATDQEFDMHLDYGPTGLSVSGLRFHAELAFNPHFQARVQVLHSAAPFAEGLLENILRIMVAYHALSRGGLLVHSACFTNGDGAWLGFGHSGAGKSTCSELAAANGMQVLSDDINVLLPADDQWQAYRVPFAGTCTTAYHGPPSPPLRALLHLRKSDETRLQSLSGARGMALLLASCAFVNEDPWRSEQLMANCAALLRTTPVQALYFRKTPGFLELLMNEYESRTHDIQAVA